MERFDFGSLRSAKQIEYTVNANWTFIANLNRGNGGLLFWDQAVC